MIYLPYFIYYWINIVSSTLGSIYSTKNYKQHSRGTILHIRFKHWTSEQFGDHANFWERDCFSIGIWPVLKWVSWSYTLNNVYYRDSYSLSCVIDRKPIKDLFFKSVCVLLSSLSCLLMVWGESWVELITIQQSKCSIQQVLLFQLDWYHL